MSTKILVIDDEPGWRTFGSKKLGQLPNYDVNIVGCQEVETALTPPSHYDLAILSSRCLEAAKIIKISNVPFIVATGQTTCKEAVGSYRLGALNYIQKDFRTEKCVPPIEQAIKTHRAIQNRLSTDTNS